MDPNVPQLPTEMLAAIIKIHLDETSDITNIKATDLAAHVYLDNYVGAATNTALASHACLTIVERYHRANCERILEQAVKKEAAEQRAAEASASWPWNADTAQAKRRAAAFKEEVIIFMEIRSDFEKVLEKRARRLAWSQVETGITRPVSKSFQVVETLLSVLFPVEDEGTVDWDELCKWH